MLLALLALLLEPPTPVETKTVRVMSYNIRYADANDGVNGWEDRRDFLAETIRAFSPDLLGTQEVLARQRDDLRARLDGFEVLAAGREDGRERGEMTAIFVRRDRFSQLDGGHFWLSETPEVVGSRGWDASLPRMATWVKLQDRTDPNGPPIAFFNTHLDHRGVQARIEAARLLRRKIDELGGGCRVVVTGDFNSGAGSPPYRALFGSGDAQLRPLRDTLRVVHPTPVAAEGTFTGFQAGRFPGDRIDWIGCSTDWTVEAAMIVDASRAGRTPSDHHAVTAVLRGRMD